MPAARGRIEPHQAGDIPHTAPSTTRARSRAQGAVQRRHRVASQENRVQALRVVLFGLLLAETQARIQLFSKDDAAVKAAQTNHVLDKDKRFVYQKWDAQASKLVTDPDKKGLTLEEVMAILTELRKLSNDQTITKFNASRRLKKEPDNDEKAVFTVEVAMRSPPANRIQGLLDQMTDNAAWGLVAAQLRPPTQSQTPRASHCHSEGAGGRLDGSIQPGRSSPRSTPPLCPITVPPVASQRMRNLSNTCYINSLTFTILWQVQQRVDINVSEAWQRAQAQGTWTPANVLRFTMLGWRQPDQQHDVVEFMQFLLPRIPWLGSAFMWGARLIDRGGIVRHIHQPNAHVIPLDPLDSMCDSNLQNTINAWHQQYAIHGRCQAPTHLYMHLGPNRQQGRANLDYGTLMTIRLLLK